MRSGLKHLLAYRLTSLNKPCHMISKCFAFSSIVIVIDEAHVEIRRDDYVTTWVVGYDTFLSLDQPTLNVEASSDFITIVSCHHFTRELEFKERDEHFSDMQELIKSGNYKQVMDYCGKLINN